MKNQSFLDKLATEILTTFPNQLSDVVIVLPNKRAKIFLIAAIQKQIENNVFAPKITNIEDFVQEVSDIRNIDPVELLFEFYNVYLSLTPMSAQQGFDVFANWAKTLLQDFNEIDRYLLDPNHVLSYIKDIEDIKKWGVEVENKTDMLEKYVAFWIQLPIYYHALYKHLLQKKIGYQGLVYREANKNIAAFTKTVDTKQYIFAGFNALNKAEENIIQHLISQDVATIFWDADQTFLNDPYHDAGLFLRSFKSKWKHYKSNAFEWIVDEFSGHKNIQIIGTPKTIGQAKIAGKIVENILKNKTSTAINLEDVAIVLGDENLLIPMLYSLPSNVGGLNITMGYSSKNNPAQILIAKLFKMHSNAIKRNESNYLFYYKDVLDVLTHPLVQPYANANLLVDKINKFNFTFITHKKLFELQESTNSFFNILFKKWNISATDILSEISGLLLLIKTQLNTDNDDNKISKTFVYSIYKTINKISTYCANNPIINNIESLQSIYKQVIELAEVSFEGEPLSGLQIMGVLESRVLDFETVIITSMNEGCLPAGKSMNSFIPYDVKKELELPTFKEKDAIYTYHFYHLLQRAKNIYLIYNTESDGLDGGEKSRFLTQLMVEKQTNHNLTHEIFNADLPAIAHKPIVVPKSESVMKRLREIATEGFSPSSLTAYIRNPIDFYFSRILRIKQLEEVEESIAANTLGTIIHKTLEALYLPLLNKALTTTDIENCLKNLDDEVLAQFKNVFKEGDIKKGRNLLAFEIAKRNIANFLKQEIQDLEKGVTLKILYLECSLEHIIEHPSLPFPVKLKGNVDRIELRNDTIRIIDYKTGKVEARQLVLTSWQNLTSDIKNEKIIQLLCYAMMIENQIVKHPLEVGILSFKNLKTGFMLFGFKTEKVVDNIIDAQILEPFTNELVKLLNEILDQTTDFEEKQ